MNNFTFEYANQKLIDYFNIQPSEVKGRHNIATEYYKRLLYNLVYSVYEFKLPESWKLNYFRFWLFHYGSIAAIYTKEFGWIASNYGILELDIYYNPAKIQVWNRFLKDEKVGLIGINSEIIHIFDDYFGIDDTVTRYAQKLASIDKAFDINIMNANLSLLAEVDSKKAADTIYELFAKATEGNPLVITNTNTLNGKEFKYLFPDVSRNYIGDKLQQQKRGVINEFLTIIGIKNSNYEKRERLISSEVNQNNDETSAIAKNIIYANIKKGFNKLNEISGLDLQVRLNYDYVMEIANSIIGDNKDATTNIMGD